MKKNKEEKNKNIMDKNKSMFFTLMVVFCVALAGIGGFFLGMKFRENNKVVEEKLPTSGDINGQK